MGSIDDEELRGGPAVDERTSEPAIDCAAAWWRFSGLRCAAPRTFRTGASFQPRCPMSSGVSDDIGGRGASKLLTWHFLEMLSVGVAASVVMALAVLAAAEAPGHLHPHFTACESRCKAVCEVGLQEPPSELALRLFMWSCADECAYTCMHDLEARRYEHGHDPLQYHGKWPFFRVFGMQEVVSVVLSLLTAAIHAAGVRRMMARSTSPVSLSVKVVAVYGVLGVVSMLLSAVFHSRDTGLTERLDYVGAFLSNIAMTAAIGAMWLRGAHVALSGYVILLMAIFVHHVSTLLGPRIDYGHNMRVNITVAGTSIILCLGYVVRHGVLRNATLLVSAILFTLAGICEIVEMTPWLGLVDSHALFHACSAAAALHFWAGL